MGWTTYRYRPLGTGLLRGNLRWMRGRVIVQYLSVPVLEPMREYKTVGLTENYEHAFADLRNVQTRCYLKATALRQSTQKSVRVSASIGTSASSGGPYTETEWVTFQDNMGLSEPKLRVWDPSEYDRDYFSFGMTVWQDPRNWGGPFEVVYELWSNAYVYHHKDKTEKADLQQMGVHHWHHDLTNRRKPEWTGG